MNIEGVRANLVSQGMKVLFSPLRVRKSYVYIIEIRHGFIGYLVMWIVVPGPFTVYILDTSISFRFIVV